MIEFKGSHFEQDIILWGVRWYVAYPISYRKLEEMMEERGVEVDHATLNRWVLKYIPVLEQAFRLRKRPVGTSWRMDETYVRIKGAWKYLYRAVDKAGQRLTFSSQPSAIAKPQHGSCARLLLSHRCGGHRQTSSCLITPTSRANRRSYSRIDVRPLAEQTKR
jgi:hypothetical protein